MLVRARHSFPANFTANFRRAGLGGPSAAKRVRASLGQRITKQSTRINGRPANLENAKQQLQLQLQLQLLQLHTHSI